MSDSINKTPPDDIRKWIENCCLRHFNAAKSMNLAWPHGVRSQLAKNVATDLAAAVEVWIADAEQCRFHFELDNKNGAADH